MFRVDSLESEEIPTSDERRQSEENATFIRGDAERLMIAADRMLRSLKNDTPEHIVKEVWDEANRLIDAAQAIFMGHPEIFTLKCCSQNPAPSKPNYDNTLIGGFVERDAMGQRKLSAPLAKLRGYEYMIPFPVLTAGYNLWTPTVDED